MTRPETTTIQDPNHPDPVTFAPKVLFHVVLGSTGPNGESWVNLNDGQRITANPATSADYVPHPARTAGQNTVKHSAGKKIDGSDF